MQIHIIWWSMKHSYVTSLGLNRELVTKRGILGYIFHLWHSGETITMQWSEAMENTYWKDFGCSLCVCVCVVGVCQWQAKSRYSSRLDTVCKRLVSTDHFDQSFAGPALLVCTVIITMLMNGDRVSSNSRPLFWQPPTANRRARSRDLH